MLVIASASEWTISVDSRIDISFGESRLLLLSRTR